MKTDAMETVLTEIKRQIDEKKLLARLTDHELAEALRIMRDDMPLRFDPIITETIERLTER